MTDKKTILTREDYINKRCTHRQYYAQFVTPAVLKLVKDHIGDDTVKASKDPYFNDTPLKRWDDISVAFKQELSIAPQYKEWLGVREPLWCLSSAVCILKEAANQIREGKP